MAYATINDLETRLGADYAGLYGSDGTTAAQADLDASAAEIDASAGCRYETPVSSGREPPKPWSYDFTWKLKIVPVSRSTT